MTVEEYAVLKKKNIEEWWENCFLCPEVLTLVEVTDLRGVLYFEGADILERSAFVFWTGSEREVTEDSFEE